MAPMAICGWRLRRRRDEGPVLCVSLATSSRPRLKYAAKVDQAAAQAAHEGIKPIIDAQKGRFNGLLAGTGTDSLVKASTQLGWNISGHFLAYCVIARTDGKAFDAADQYPQQIIFDVVGTYLVKGVVGARQTGAPAAAGAASTSAKPS